MSNVLFYNTDTGAAAVGQATDNKFLTTQEFNNGSFSTGWTHIVDEGDLLFYNKATGSAGTGSLDRGKFISGQAFGSGFFAPGWTHVARMLQNILFYRADTGEGAIVKTNPFATIKSFPPGAFAKGWTHIVWSKGLGLFYSASNGAAAIAEEFHSGSGGGFAVPNDLRTVKGFQAGSFSTGWTSIVALANGNLLFYNKNDGSGAIGAMSRNGFQTLRSFPKDDFARGWTNITRAGNSALFYNRTDRSGALGFNPTVESFPSNSFGPWSHLATQDDAPVIH